MVAQLLDRRHVPPGLEIVISDGEFCPGSGGGVWNLWWNVTLSDDPCRWDDEVRALNDECAALDELSDDARLVRAHMAEFCRYWPPFPGSIDLLVAEAGAGRMLRGAQLGCEGRGLLDALGLHPDEVLACQSAEVYAAYDAALLGWLEGERPLSSLEVKIAGFMGQPTAAKVDWVHRLHQALAFGDGPQAEASAEALCAKACGRASSGAAAHRLPFRCLQCPGRRPHKLCCHTMRLDAGLLAAGAGSQEPLDDQDLPSCDVIAAKLQTYTREHLTCYASALEAWLAGQNLDGLCTMSGEYVPRAKGVAVTTRVAQHLGPLESAGPQQRWLVRCLLKTLRGNGNL